MFNVVWTSYPQNYNVSSTAYIQALKMVIKINLKITFIDIYIIKFVMILNKYFLDCIKISIS